MVNERQQRETLSLTFYPILLFEAVPVETVLSILDKSKKIKNVQIMDIIKETMCVEKGFQTLFLWLQKIWRNQLMKSIFTCL